MKVLGTNTFIHGSRLDALRRLGYQGCHAQFRIVCKCKSVADANRICGEHGFSDRVFRPDWYSETGNLNEIEICERFTVAICKGGTNGNEYIGLEELDSVVKSMEEETI